MFAEHLSEKQREACLVGPFADIERRHGVDIAEVVRKHMATQDRPDQIATTLARYGQMSKWFKGSS